MITHPERPTLAMQAQRLRIEFAGRPPEPPRVDEPMRPAVPIQDEYCPRKAA